MTVKVSVVVVSTTVVLLEKHEHAHLVMAIAQFGQDSLPLSSGSLCIISHQIRCWTSLASILALQRFSYLQERSLLIPSVPQYPFLYFTYLYTTLFHFQQFLTIYCGLASQFHCFFLNSQV